MTIKKSIRLLAAVLTIAMMFSFVACNTNGQFNGSLKLESFIIDPNSYKAEYVVGEKVDFSGIQAIVKYNDETLNKTYTAAELTITYDDDITAEVGEKEVTISFQDTNLGVKQEVKITIKVVAYVPEVTTPVESTESTPVESTESTPEESTESTPEESTESTPEESTESTPEESTESTPEESTETTPEVTTPEETTPQDELEIIDFKTPAGLVSFNSANKNAGTLKYGESGFAGQFAVGSQMYVIGNQNEFKFNPSVEILNVDTDAETKTNQFYANVVLSIQKDGAYVALTAVAKGGNVVEYYDGNVLIATVNTYKGIYQFTADAADKVVQISVVPSNTYYYVDADDFTPIVFESKIINAYNVYEAWQLAVVDNYNAEWIDFKISHGIADLTVSGIVLHNDITLTANDVPDSFFYTTTAPVNYYKYDEEGKLVLAETKPAGTKFLRDEIMIYDRFGAQDFAIEGNFFTLSTKDFPVVASPGVFGKDAEKDYKEDFSNSALFRFTTADWALITDESMIPTDVADVTVNNIALIGNAARDTLVDSLESLASAGGLIFFKATTYTNAVMNNIIGNSYFITYFTDWGGDMIVSNSKCYDSYQNAAFVWSNGRFELIDSYVSGCGGPAIIAQSVQLDGYWPWHPVVIVNGGEIDTSLSGQEIWFTAVGANSLVDSIKLLGMGLQQGGLGNFVDASGKMNIMSAVMAKGSAADEIVTNIDAQGSIMIDGKGIDRFASAENINWAYIYQITQGAMQLGQMPPFFTVTGADGAVYSIYYNGVTFVDLAGKELGTDPSHAALVAAFMQADTIALTQGGLSVVFEFYHY